MKYIKWKSIWITCAACILPILIGAALWNQLPDKIAIHFNVYSEPDQFASKGVAVFGLPLLLLLLQAVCCVIHDWNTFKHGEYKMPESIAKWIIPVMSIVVQCAILGYSVGWNIDMRKVATVIVCILFFLLGYGILKADTISAEQARKMSRFTGAGMIILGMLGIITVFLPPIYAIVWLFLLLLHTIISVVYGVAQGRKMKR